MSSYNVKVVKENFVKGNFTDSESIMSKVLKRESMINYENTYHIHLKKKNTNLKSVPRYARREDIIVYPETRR